ncbi:MAG: bifunctional UDP-N-acetylglucosamine diphosphorylase/glucosamine-1-phosphate N-acetyltransferase GlmU [Actinomycetota bacterium]
MDNRGLAVIVLAAGKGKRMNSDVPKVLHRICGRPLLGYVLDQVVALDAGEVIVVVGHGAEQVEPEIGSRGRPVPQPEQLGTGHAVMTALEALDPRYGEVLVLPGDSPLLRAGTLAGLVEARRAGPSAASILTAWLEDPSGYGRVLRDEAGAVRGVVEESDATDEQKAIDEVNACTYCFDRAALETALGSLGRDNAQGEYYLTDAVAGMVDRGLLVVPRVCALEEILGVNDREQLSTAEALMRGRINRSWMEAGVSMTDPALTYIDFGVEVGGDTAIMPLVFLTGRTRLGRGCRIGPMTCIKDSTLGDGCSVELSWLDGCLVADDVSIGPYSRLRPGCELAAGSRVGSFVEMKNTTLGRGSKVPHLSYIGDARIGEETNVGAGSITCNYDGEAKHETVIGDRAFIGSDTMLVAPVEIGDDATTGAGSAISRDVPAGGLGIERCEQKNVEGWRKKKRKKGRE